jgi:uncharacterized protein
LPTLDLTFTAYLPQMGAGILIGLSAVLLLLTIGRIAGISSILNNWVLSRSKLNDWTIYFLVSLLLGTLSYHLIFQVPFPAANDAPWYQTLLAGLLVGIGTVIGGGCTSGHGVCGMARLSKRSISATATFVLVAALVVLVVGA